MSTRSPVSPNPPSNNSITWTNAQLKEAIRSIDDTWNEMLTIRSSLTVSPPDCQKKFVDLCVTMKRWIFELHQNPEWDDLIDDLHEHWDILQAHHDEIDWKAIKELNEASLAFQERLAHLPILLERTSEDVFPPNVERWSARVDRLAVADRMEALESEVQRLRLILENLGGCGDGVEI